jgi:hypothetical protein
MTISISNNRTYNPLILTSKGGGSSSQEFSTMKVSSIDLAFASML